ncbi:MAG: ion channel [Sphingopyxis sp.]
MNDTLLLTAIFDDLVVSTILVVLTVAFHGTVLTLFARLLRSEAREEASHHIPALSLRSLIFTVALVLALFTLHGIEIWLYAFVYVWIGAIGDIATAAYYSTISYAAIGYTDHYIAPEWRMVAAIEGINGLLLMGWSTAFFVSVVTQFQQRR